MANAPLAPETIIVPNDSDVVCCDGGSGPQGHPLVYYSFERKESLCCGYCGRRFVRERALKSA